MGGRHLDPIAEAQLFLQRHHLWKLRDHRFDKGPVNLKVHRFLQRKSLMPVS
jgi:hypothetical protein